MKELAKEYFGKFDFGWTKPEPTYIGFSEFDFELIRASIELQND